MNRDLDLVPGFHWVPSYVEECSKIVSCLFYVNNQNQNSIYYRLENYIDFISKFT